MDDTWLGDSQELAMPPIRALKILGSFKDYSQSVSKV